MNIERILFPVDFSDQSRAAASFVKAMAARFHAEVVLLNVMELPEVWYGAGEGVGFIPPFDVDQLRDEAEEKLEGYLTAEFAGVKIRRILAEGDAAKQIVCHAKSLKASVIMMPTHGYGPYRSLLLGSVTAKVLHDADCPVWTGVHTPEFTSHFPAEFRSHPVRGGPGSQGCSRHPLGHRIRRFCGRSSPSDSRDAGRSGHP